MQDFYETIKMNTTEIQNKVELIQEWIGDKSKLNLNDGALKGA